ncbi:MAG: iron chaperone [Anaerolineae bacterium]
MRSNAATVEEYLAALPEDRRAAIEQVRQVILANLPDGYEEAMNWGMITYQVPLATHPDTYNGQPLMYAALASQKNHMAVYLMGIYGSEDSWADFEEAYRATGKRYDVGKSCVRFKRIDDLPLELIGEKVAETSVDEFIAAAEAARRR